MKTFETAAAWWPSFEAQRSDPGLRVAIDASSETDLIVNGGRSAFWKSFLLLDEASISEWPDKLEKIREAFDDLRKRFLDPLERPNQEDYAIDPLSDSINSPWETLRKDERVMQEINQDVERCLPDNLYFRQPTVQSMLSDILFVWTKLNPDVGYRQGMHELLAPILWTVDTDSIEPQSIRSSSTARDFSEGIASIFDNKYVSHDTFAIFTKIMQQAKSSYEIHDLTYPAHVGQNDNRTTNQDAAITERSRKIFDSFLPQVDPTLSAHLTEIGIIPQIFLIRWVRLLFSREFSFDSVLQIWDKLFAEGITPLCIDLVCVAMLLRIRWQLLDSDNSEALKLLLHFPDLPPEHTPATLVDDAEFLKTHLNIEGGRQLISRRSGRLPPSADPPVIPSGGKSPEELPPRTTPFSNLENILNDTVRNIATKGERWGVYQAVRDLSGDLRKNVSTFQSKTHSRMYSRDSIAVRGQKSENALLRKINELDTRNRSLARMLEGAVAELWQQQKEKADDKPADDEQMEAFTTAIAKVQFVQIYLEDSSLGMPPEDVDKGDSDSHSEPKAEQRSPTPSTRSVDPGISISHNPDKSKSEYTQSPPNASTLEKPPSKASEDATNQQTKSRRPPLDQSSFSWMLGQEPQPSSARGAFLSSSPFSGRTPSSKRLSRGQSAYLFGEEGDNNTTPEKASTASANSSTLRPKHGDLPLSNLKGKDE